MFNIQEWDFDAEKEAETPPERSSTDEQERRPGDIL